MRDGGLDPKRTTVAETAAWLQFKREQAEHDDDPHLNLT